MKNEQQKQQKMASSIQNELKSAHKTANITIMVIMAVSHLVEQKKTK